MKVPVLFIIFNRPDIAATSFEAIRAYQPEHLYIAADGPRQERSGEDELCATTRQRIIKMIDWPCEVHTLFRDENVGVDLGVYGAINWMFETEPWGVIVEDDCLLSTDFFRLCEEAFPKYASNEKVMHIIANNPMATIDKSAEVDFVSFPMSWGWGTWADKWKKYMDTDMKSYPSKRWFLPLVKKYGLFLALLFYRYWKPTYKRRHLIKPWDTIWQFSVLTNNGLCLQPRVNLAVNNGIGTCEGSHYEVGEENYYHNLTIGKLNYPIMFPTELKNNTETEKQFKRYFTNLRLFGLRKRIKAILQKIG